MPVFDGSTYYESLVAGESVPELSGYFFKARRDDHDSTLAKTAKPTVRFFRLLGFELKIFKTVDDLDPFEIIDLHDLLSVRIPSKVPRAAAFFRKFDGGFDLVTLRNGTLSLEIAAKDAETYALYCALTSFKSVTTAAPIIYLTDGNGGNGNLVAHGDGDRKMVRVFGCLRGAMLLLFDSQENVNENPAHILDLTDLRTVKIPSLQPEARRQGFDLIFHDQIHTFMQCRNDSRSRQMCATLTAWQSKQMLHISELKEGVAYMKFELQRDVAHGQGFGMVVTNCPSVDEGPAWPGKFLDHLRVTTLPLLGDASANNGKGSPGPAQAAGMRLNDAILMIDNIGNDGGILRTLADVGAAVKGKGKIVVEVARLPLEVNTKDPNWKNWNNPVLEKKYRVLGEVQNALRVRQDLNVDGTEAVKQLTPARRKSYVTKHMSVRKGLALAEEDKTETKTRRKKGKKYGFAGVQGSKLFTNAEGASSKDEQNSRGQGAQGSELVLGPSSPDAVRALADEQRRFSLLGHVAPPDLPPPTTTPDVSKEHKKHRVQQASSPQRTSAGKRRSSSKTSLPKGWRAYKDKKGRTYYAHKDGRVQWKRPGSTGKRGSSKTASLKKAMQRQGKKSDSAPVVADSSAPFLVSAAASTPLPKASKAPTVSKSQRRMSSSSSSSSSSSEGEDEDQSAQSKRPKVKASQPSKSSANFQSALSQAMATLSNSMTPQEFMAQQAAKNKPKTAKVKLTHRRAASINEIPLDLINKNLPKGWKAFHDPQKRTYFAHKDGTVQWHPPSENNSNEI